jgi:UDP-N-acetylmuramoylalanine--D-glutamate ligase
VTTALVYGIAVAGDALALALHRRGVRVLVADDAPTDDKARLAAAVGADLVATPDPVTLESLVRASDLVCPAPGVPETHDVVRTARRLGRPVRSEIDLAYEWEQQRPGGPRPMLAVTGTDGKTTTTLLVAEMLRHAGHRAAAVGNTEVPLVAALDSDAEVFAVECSSFRLAFADVFRAEASVWLNLAPDHQNWHVSLDSYEAAKARMWAHLRPSDVAVGFAADPVVMRNLQRVTARTRTFGAPAADYRVEGDRLVGPSGPIARVAVMRRALPHDLTNALAAAALVIESGLADAVAVEAALATFVHPPHRIEPLGEIDGVRWFNDSKATTPHAALTAIRAFDRVVLLAGGRNKGLDLAALATEAQRIVAVVALGEAAGEVAAAFAGVCPVVTARDMAEAVDAAAHLATPGDVVLLSPACASFDWYDGYPARGDDFTRLVAERRSDS